MRRDTKGILRDVFSIGLLGLNSFLMLFYKGWLVQPIKYVICAGVLAYVLILLSETALLWREKHRLEVVYKTRRVFKVIYAAIYMTALMIHIIDLLQDKQPGYRWQTAWLGLLFIFAGIWGANSRWLPTIKEKALALYRKTLTHR